MVQNSDIGAGAQTPASFVSGEDFRTDAPILALTLWPHRSLSRKGMARVIGVAAIGLAIPVLPFLGSPVGWALLPFCALPVLALWLFIRRNNRDGRLTETIRLWQDEIRVDRRHPSGDVRCWQANPYWVKITLRDDGPVEQYLTLKGNGREIELGAFLSPEERIDLFHDLSKALNALDINAPFPLEP